MKKELLLFGVIAVLSTLAMLRLESVTGGIFVQCPEGFYYSDGFCIENECENVKCIKEYNFIKRPDCVCTRYLDKIGCSIKGGEKTMIKSPLCTRQGQLNNVCGSYDSDKGHCVDNPRLAES